MATKYSRVQGVTIEIGGDTQKLEEALRGVNKIISTTQRSLTDINKLLKLDPTNTVLLTQKQDLLTKSIDATTGKLDVLKEAERQMEAAGIDKQSAEFQGLEREIAETEQALKSLNKQYNQFGSVGIQQIEAVGQKMQNLGGKISSIGSGIESAGKKLTKITSPIAAVGAAGIKAFGSFEQTISAVAAAMGTTSDQIQNIQDKALELGESTAFSATQAAEGFVILARAGYDAEEQIALLPKILDLAAAGELSLADAAGYVTGMLEGFHDESMSAGEAATYYSDLVAKGASQAKTDVSELGEAMTAVSATAKMFGQSAEDAEVALLKLAQQNVTGSEAATALYRTMTDLYTPTEKAAEALTELGIATYDENSQAKNVNVVIQELNDKLSQYTDEQKNAYLGTIFSQRGLKAYNMLATTGAEVTEDFYKALETAGGSAGQQADTMLDNINGRLTIFKNRAQSAGITIGQKLTPYVGKLLDGAEDLLKRFSELDDETLEMITNVGLVAVAAGPALVVLGKVTEGVGSLIRHGGQLITGIGKLSALLASHPIALAIAGTTAAVTALGVAIATNATKSREDFSSIITSAQETADAFSATSEKISGVTQSLESVREAREKNNESVLASFAITERDIELLKALTDENGNIIKGHEDDVEMILGRLSEAYGVEYTIVGDQIQQYDDLVASIDEVITKKKGQALLDANMSEYTEAYKNQAKYATELATAEEELAALKANLAANTEELNAAQQHYNVLMKVAEQGMIEEYFPTYQAWEEELVTAEAKLSALSTANETLSASVATGEANIAGLSAELANSETFMQHFESLEYDIANGSTEAINDSMLALTYNLKTFKDSTVTELESQVQEYERKYEAMLKASEDGNARISDAQLEAMKTMVRLSKEQLDLLVEDMANTKWESETQGKLIGKALAEGMSNGTNAYAYLVRDAAGNMAQEALTKIKRITGINSPSKETAWMGEMLDKGLEKGILDFSHLPEEAAGTMAGDVLASMGGNDILTSGAQRAAVASNTTNNSYMGGVTLNVYGAAGQDVDELADVISEKIAVQYDRTRAVFA